MSHFINYGIDLGTTNSCIACWHEDAIKIFQNNDQMNVTPSAVYISKNGRIIVGRKAYDFLEVAPENVATNFKRLMGHKCDIYFPAAEKTMFPEELSAEILKSLLNDVARRTGETITEAVITVPAAFGTLQCESTLKAAQLAGLRNSPLLQEPIAAVLGYGVSPDHRNQRWLIFDLGGGTLDVAIVSTRDGRLSVVEHKGNNFLGGKDIDKAIVDRYILPVLKEYAMPDGEAYDQIYKGLLKLAETAKIALSTAEKVYLCDCYTSLGVDVEGSSLEIDANIILTREQLEFEIRPLVDNCIAVVKEALYSSRLAVEDINKILLVGGPTNMPIIRQALASSICPRIDYSFDPMTVVARGAAVYASSIELQGAVEPPSGQQMHSNAKKDVEKDTVSVTIAYDPVTAITKNIVAGKFDTGERLIPAEVNAETENGLWTSGWVPVDPASGYFEFAIIVPEGKTTKYNFSARDRLGRLLKVDKSNFLIKHVMIASTAPVIPQTIFVETVRTDGSRGLDAIIKRGTSLPAQNTLEYRADKTLRPSDANSFLAIKLWEGESHTDPEANTWVGNVYIYSHWLTRPIPEGAILEVHVQMDTSRHINVDVYVPYLNEGFSNKVFVAENELINPMAQVDMLPAEIETHHRRLNGLKINLPDNTGQDVYAEIKKVEQDIESVDIETGKIFHKGLPSASDYDIIAKTADMSRKIREKLARIETRLGIDRMQVVRMEEIKNQVDATAAAVNDYGDAQDAKELELLIRDLDIANSNKDFRGLNRVYEKLDGLRWRVLFRQDWFWVDMFRHIKQSEGGFINRIEAQHWLNYGDQAIQDNNSNHLREAVRNLWKLQTPDTIKRDRERAMPSGLRKA